MQSNVCIAHSSDNFGCGNRQHYTNALTTRSPIMAWMMRHCAYLTTNYLLHSDGQTSYFRRWQRNNTAPICEFGGTVLYMVPRFFNGIWLGRDTTTSESFIRTAGEVVRARTIRRQVGPHKYNNELLDTINGTPWSPTPPTYTPTFLRPSVAPMRPETAEKAVAARREATEEHTDPRDLGGEENTKRQRTTGTMIEDRSVTTTATATAESSTVRCQLDDAITHGSEAKQQKKTEQQTAAQRPEPDPTQPTSKMRINVVTVTLNNGKQVTTATSEDQQEVRNEQRLLEPIIYNTEGFDPTKVKQGMMKEMSSMRQQEVHDQVHISETTQEERANIIESKWVHRDKAEEV